MSLFSKLFGSRQKNFNSAIFGFFSPSDIPRMGEKEFLRAYKGWVYACTNAVAKRVADIELKLQKRTNSDWKDIPSHPALDLLRKVNAFNSFYDLAYATQAFLELDGNAFWYIPRNGNKAPSEIWILDPTRTSVVKSKKEFISGYVFTTETSDKVPLETDEVIHFKRFNPLNQYRGMGTVQAAALPIDIDNFASEWQRNFFGNAAMPSGILSTDGTLTQDQYDRIKANWDSKYKGVQNAHKMALLEGGLKFQSLTPTSREMQFTEGRKNVRDEILGIFQVPKPILGIFDDVNLASAQVAEYTFSKDRIRPDMKFFVTKLNEFYLPLFNLDSNVNRLWFADPVPENIEQKLEIIANGRGSIGTGPWMTANEARAVFGYEPVEGGDVLEEPTVDAPVEGSDEPDDPAHTAQDEEDEDEQENEEKRVKKNISKEVKRKANAYKQEQIKALTKTYVDLNDKLKTQLLTNLKQKSAQTPPEDETYLEKLARIVRKDTAVELIAALFDGYDKWGDVIYATSLAAMKKIMAKGGSDGLAEVNVDGTFDLENPRAVAWLEQYAMSSSNSYSDTMKADISQVVTDGVDQGLSRDQIANNLSGFFDETSQYKATRIARTETIAAYSQSNLESYIQSGVVESKVWWFDGGNCSSGECPGNVDDGTIPLDAAFSSGVDSPPSHPNCLLAGTKIQTENGLKNIEEIQVGDKVFTHRKRYMPVVALSKRHYEGEMITLLADKIEITATLDHPFLTEEGWKYSEDIVLTDSLYHFGNKANGFNKFNFKDITKTNFKGNVYNFEVKEDHSYVANNVISANCECDVQPVLSSDDSNE